MANKTTARPHDLRGERGETLVEFALSAVVLFMTLFGIVQFGLAVWQYNMVANLAQEGARFAAVHGKASKSPASATDVRTYVNSRSVMGAFASTDIDVTPVPSGAAKGATITVTVRRSFALFTPIVRTGSLALRGSAQMIVAQ
jgi:Flp pilus assembly protein TadG